MKNQENLIRFMDKIDCNFPYSDLTKSKFLIDEATEISEEAVFSIIHEIVRVPKGTSVKVEDRKELLKYINNSFDHPLKETVLNLSRMLIEEQEISTEKIISVMNKISGFKDNYNALSIAYFASWSEEIEEIYDDIKEQWEGSKP